MTFYVANLASALPAQFPTASRYGAMGIAYNFAVAIFGGTTPFIIAALITATGNDMMPAYYLMATSADRRRRHLLPEGIRPDGRCRAPCPAWTRRPRPGNWWQRQDENPLIDLDDMPFMPMGTGRRSAGRPRGREGTGSGLSLTVTASLPSRLRPARLRSCPALCRPVPYAYPFREAYAGRP